MCIRDRVEGEIVWLGAKIGDVVAVGSDLVRLKVRDEDNSSAPTGARVAPRAKAPAAETAESAPLAKRPIGNSLERAPATTALPGSATCLLYTSDAADDLTRVDLGGRRIIK